MKNLFDIKGKVVVLTGGCGVLGQCIARYLAEQGAHMMILDRVVEVGKQFEAELNQLTESLFLETNVLDAAKLEQNCKDILAKFGTIDVLLNAAGGNMGAANIAPDQTFLDASDDAIHKVVELNLFGTILPTKVFGRVICEKKEGAIVGCCSTCQHTVRIGVMQNHMGKWNGVAVCIQHTTSDLLFLRLGRSNGSCQDKE
jgi:NADP-dependent 3-hydroxy acid dehydrogenase YdfG